MQARVCVPRDLSGASSTEGNGFGFFFPCCLLKMQLVVPSGLESWSWKETTELP